MARAGKSRLRSFGLRAAADDLGRGQKLRAAAAQCAALAGALPENLLTRLRDQAVPRCASPSPAAWPGQFNGSALPPKADIGTGPVISFDAPAPAAWRYSPRSAAPWPDVHAGRGLDQTLLHWQILCYF